MAQSGSRTVQVMTSSPSAFSGRGTLAWAIPTAPSRARAEERYISRPFRERAKSSPVVSNSRYPSSSPAGSWPVKRKVPFFSGILVYTPIS